MIIILFIVIYFLFVCLCIGTKSHKKKSGFGTGTLRKGLYNYDEQGFNCYGYDKHGKNEKGQYNRYYDLVNFESSIYSADGFLNPHTHPIAITDHAYERVNERMGIESHSEIAELAKDAYRYGKSARQLNKTSAAQLRAKEQKHENTVMLIYKGHIFVFTEDNVLITVYKNEYIRL